MQFDNALINKAWRVRCRNFPPSVTLYKPSATLPVSLTGEKCALQCAHCGGRLLKKMLPWDKFKSGRTPEKAPGGQGFTSCLISGGCDGQGQVPFGEHLRELKNMKESLGLRFNFHTGLVGEKEAGLLKGLADVVSFDFPGSDQTIRNILGLPGTVADYAASYKALKANVPVIPHICIGIDGGRLDGEQRALELLGEIGAEGLVFIVFTPAPGTPLEHRSPPPLDQVVHLLARARIDFPDIPLHLGCMRPGGRYRRELDLLALGCGINGLVTPCREAAAEAQRLGLTINYGNECCVL